jgi:hypothetical protein
VEGVWREGVRELLFGLGGLYGNDEKAEISEVAFFIQGGR